MATLLDLLNSSKNVVVPCPQHGALAELCPRLQMTETTMLPEVMHQVDVVKFCQQVVNELAAQVLGIIQVHAEIFHQDWVLAPEDLQGLH